MQTSRPRCKSGSDAHPRTSSTPRVILSCRTVAFKEWVYSGRSTARPLWLSTMPCTAQLMQPSETALQLDWYAIPTEGSVALMRGHQSPLCPAKQRQSAEPTKMSICKICVTWHMPFHVRIYLQIAQGYIPRPTRLHEISMAQPCYPEQN